jgi:hypothetical protein
VKEHENESTPAAERAPSRDAPRQPPVGAAAVLELQRTLGNSAVARLAGSFMQPRGERETTGSRISRPVAQPAAPAEAEAPPDEADCVLVGHSVEADGSYASVESTATLSDPTHVVRYEIKWTADAVPGGSHLGQVAGVASDWVLDRDEAGNPIGPRQTGGQLCYFRDDSFGERVPDGLYFYYADGIEQRRFESGKWWFRLRIVDAGGTEVACSDEVEIDWGQAAAAAAAPPPGGGAPPP